MRKGAIAFVGLSLMLPLSAGAAEVTSKISQIDRERGTAILEDGTVVSVSEQWLPYLEPGETIQTSFENKNGQNVATSIDRRAMGPGGETTNFGATEPSADFEQQAPGGEGQASSD